MEELRTFFTQASGVLGTYIPKALGALVLLVVAWVVASLLKAVIVRLGRAAKLDDRVGFPATASFGDIVYWLVFLFFLPGILESLGLEQLLLPIQSMISKIMNFLPNLLAAGIIFFIGYFVAKLVRNIATNLLAASGADNLPSKLGFAGAMGNGKVSTIVGTVVFALIIIPVAEMALSALQLDVITRPLEAMMTKMVTALPNIIVAAAIVAIASFLGRLLGRFVSDLLAGVGFDSLVAKAGIKSCEGNCSPSSIFGWVATAGVILLAVMEAADLIGFTALSGLVKQFSVFASQLVAGVVILGLGVYLSSLATKAIIGAGVPRAELLAGVARIAILVFAATMALREIGLASDIVNMAFGLLLGAVALAVALSFGLGGRESAGKLIEEWRESIKSRKP